MGFSPTFQAFTADLSERQLFDLAQMPELSDEARIWCHKAAKLRGYWQRGLDEEIERVAARQRVLEAQRAEAERERRVQEAVWSTPVWPHVRVREGMTADEWSGQ